MPQSLNEQLSREQQIAALEKDWATNPRWKGVKRGYSAADVVRLPSSAICVGYARARADQCHIRICTARSQTRSAHPARSA